MGKDKKMEGSIEATGDLTVKGTLTQSKPPVEAKKPKAPQPEDKYGMPPVPKELRVDGAKDEQLAEKLNEMIRYMIWLGKHFVKEDNFICEKCRIYYSPAKKLCPTCNPTGPNKK